MCVPLFVVLSLNSVGTVAWGLLRQRAFKHRKDRKGEDVALAIKD